MDLNSKLNNAAVIPRSFLSFCLPTRVQLDDKGEFSLWCDRMIFLVDDLKWLLSLPVDLFWNQILYDESWMRCLDSFLQNAPRCYDLKNIPANCRTAISRVSKLFLLAMKRMSLPNEEEGLSFTPEDFGNVIYNSYLFDAAKLFDMCAIFYRPDESICDILKEIIESVFLYQPLYYNDLTDAMVSMVVTMNTLEENMKSSKTTSGRDAIDKMLFLYDLTSTLKIFLELFTDASKVLFNSKMLVRLASVCETIVPALLKPIEINQKKFKFITTRIQSNVEEIIHQTIQSAFIKPVKEGKLEDGEMKTLEYMSIIHGLSQQQKLFANYCSSGRIASDLEAMKAWKLIDHSNVEYLSNMAGVAVTENSTEETIKSLREMLPNKSEHFIQECINKYGDNVDVIMNYVMERDLEGLGNSEANKRKDVKKKPVPNKDFLDDNKEHVARVKASVMFTSEGNDYDDFNNTKFYNSIRNTNRYNLYDDEYDDTYDSHDIGAVDADSADELKDLSSRRKFTTPLILRRKDERMTSSSEEESEEETDGNTEKDEDENDDQQETQHKQKQQQDRLQPSNASNRGGRRGGKQRGNVNKDRHKGRGDIDRPYENDRSHRKGDKNAYINKDDDEILGNDKGTHDRGTQNREDRYNARGKRNEDRDNSRAKRHDDRDNARTKRREDGNDSHPRIDDNDRKNRGDDNNDDRRNQTQSTNKRNEGSNRGRGGRGRGRGGHKHNRKNLADKKMSKGMF